MNKKKRSSETKKSDSILNFFNKLDSGKRCRDELDSEASSSSIQASTPKTKRTKAEESVRKRERLDKKAYAILTQKSEVLPTVREEENKQLEIAASLSDVDNSQDSNFSLSIDGEGVSAARDAMQAISQVAEETRFTNNINLEFRGMDNVFSLKGFGVFKTKSDLRELEKELEQHSLADFDRLFLIHHSNPLRCKVHQRLTETSHFQVPFSTLLSTLHFAAQVEPFRLLPTELQQKREQLPSEMFSISRKSKTLPVAEYELHELLQENLATFTDLLNLIDLQKWALSELSCLAAVFAFLFLDDKVSALRTPISAAFLHICQVVVQKEEGDEGGFAFPKKHLFTEDLLELVGKSVVQIAHLDMLFSQLLTAENLRAHTMWKSLYYYLEKQRRSKSCAGGEGEGEAMELGEEEQQQQEEKSPSLLVLFSWLPSLFAPLKENPTELYYIRHVLSTVLTGPLIARQSAHDLSLLLEHLRRAKRLLVNDRGRELSYMRSDFMIIDANDDLEHRLNMRIGVLRPQQIGFNLAPRKELSSSVIMNGGRFKPPKKTMLVCSSDEEEEANE